MKTADHWAQIIVDGEFIGLTPTKVQSTDLSVELVKRIQLDAYNQGLTDAAEITKQWVIGRKAIGPAILAALDAKP